MNDVILWMSVSLDGYMEGPGHDLSWHLVDDELHDHFNEELGRMGAFLEGRRTYELMVAFWPTADADPSNPRPVAEFAGIWREMPKYVYSTTLEHAEWNTTIVREVSRGQVMALKRDARGGLVLGGAELAAEFLRLDLIDEFRIYVHPVIIGRGTPLFRASDARLALRLEETRTFGNGVVLLRYARV
jgi:dihydrofolate reductase